MKKLILPLVLLLFLSFEFGFTMKEAKKVTVIVLGEVKDSELNIVKKALKGYYKIEIGELTIEQIPLELYINKTDTLNGASVLSYLQGLYPNTDEHVIALTQKALSLGKGGYTIRGLASDRSKNGIISTAKLRLESESEIIFKANLIKVSRHEYGHMLGLPHCEFSDSCLMISTQDEKGFLLKMKSKHCQQCKASIISSLR